MSDGCRKIILITVDSLRADALSAYGALAETPETERLAEESILYEVALATGARTMQSFPGILASNYPTTGGAIQNLGDRVSVAECFQRAGFETAAFHSNPVISRWRGYGRGFGTFYDSLAPEVGPPESPEGWHAGVARFVARRLPRLFGAVRKVYQYLFCRSIPVEQPHESARETTERAIEWLKEAEDRFFLWVHYMDPHYPYGTRLPELSERERREAGELFTRALKHPGRLTPEELRRLRTLYAAEVRYLDHWLGVLLDFLRSGGGRDETALVFTSDHGEAFLEHGQYGHGEFLYEEFLRVPLMVRAPGLEPRREPGPASLLDVAPTLCTLAGVEPSPTFEGRSLLDGPPRDCVFAETAYRLFVADRPHNVAARTREWKLVCDLEQGRDELYFLPEDPGEQRSLMDSHPDQLKEMQRRVAAHLERERPSLQPRQEAPIPSRADEQELKARLRALGYLDEAEREAE
ncbi:MAG: sulfatase [Candidatus Brocadiaceae bacterium]|jgi:arylsulfatase A-like enzyme